MRPITINLDLAKEPGPRKIARVRQGEHHSTRIEARIYDHDEPCALAGYDVYLEAVMPNGRLVQVACETEGSTASHTFGEALASMPGTVELAYISLKTHAEDGTQTLCATTEAFAIEVLPDAAKEGCGVAEAYADEIVQMLLLCKQRYEAAEAARQADYEAAEADRESQFDASKASCDAATARANAAADKVDAALSGNLDPLFKDYLDALKDAEGGFVKWETYQSEKLVPDGETVQADESHVLSVRDGGLCYAKLSDVPFPFLPNVWELEDLTIRCGEFENAGAGWNTFEFPEPFEAPPTVICQAEGYAVDVTGVEADRFLYRLTANGGTTYGTETLYRRATPSTSYPYVMALSVSSNSYTSPFTVLTSASSGSGSVSEAAKVRWIAIEDGR